MPNPNDLNDFFINVSQNVTSSITPTLEPLSFMPPSKNVANSFFLSPVTSTELLKEMKNIKSKSSCSTDGLSIKIFLNLPPPVIEVLTTLINESFIKGIFPECLKTAIIIPLHKGGDKAHLSNYRPIALLPALSKIIERLLKNRLMPFLLKHEIFSNNQFGFLPEKCTSDAMFSLLNDVYTSLNSNRPTATVFCDYAKAFDCVSHNILLKKLDFYGIRGAPSNWFKSYLGNRQQFVRANGSDSDCKLITSGVPQGSVLGPILFLIYINDITYLNISGKISLFADDTCITWNDTDAASLQLNISSDLVKIKAWSDSNLLCFNVDKTVVLSYKGDLQPLLLRDSLIKRVESVKFLGLSINDNLKWSVHIDTLTKKLSSACFAIRSVSKELNVFSARLAYFSLFEAHLRYGLPFWGCCNNEQFLSIFKLQKRAIRYLFGLSGRAHCEYYFKKYEILTLPALFILETVCLVRKHINSLPERPNHPYPTRNSSQDIYLPLPSSELIRGSIIYNAKKLYNHLPIHLKSIPTFAKFRRNAKAFLVERPFYSINEFYGA